jgi:hypothetical protein
MPGAIAFDPGRKNLAACLVDDDLKIRKWTVAAIDPCPAGLIRGLAAMNFDEWASSASDAAIERQPAKNPTMKRLEHYLEMACAMKGLRTSTIDAKHKLTYAMSTPWWPDRAIANWSYGERKKLSVETVTNMLAAGAQDPEFAAAFLGSKKKDDLADAFLHAAAYVHTVRPTLRDAPRAVRRIKPVEPNGRNAASGRYSQSNLKFLARGSLASFDAFETVDVPGFAKSCCAHFGDLGNAYVQLGGK